MQQAPVSELSNPGTLTSRATLTDIRAARCVVAYIYLHSMRVGSLH